MVSPKHVYFQHKDEDKSISPEPFKEPDGMVTIDLNGSKNKSEAKEKDIKHNVPKSKIVTELIIGLFVLNITIFVVLVIINRETYLFKTKPFGKDNKQINSELPDYKNLNSDIHIQDLIRKCLITKPLKLCCLLFADGDLDFSAFCYNQNLLSDIADIDIRKRRSAPVKTKAAKTTKENYEHPPYPQAIPIDADRFFFYEDNNDLAYEGPFEEFIYYQDDLAYLHPDFHYRTSDNKVPENKAAVESNDHKSKSDIIVDKAKSSDKKKSSTADDKNLKTVHADTSFSKSSPTISKLPENKAAVEIDDRKSKTDAAKSSDKTKSSISDDKNLRTVHSSQKTSHVEQNNLNTEQRLDTSFSKQPVTGSTSTANFENKKTPKNGHINEDTTNSKSNVKEDSKNEKKITEPNKVSTKASQNEPKQQHIDDVNFTKIKVNNDKLNSSPTDTDTNSDKGQKDQTKPDIPDKLNIPIPSANNGKEEPNHVQNLQNTKSNSDKESIGTSNLKSRNSLISDEDASVNAPTSFRDININGENTEIQKNFFDDSKDKSNTNHDPRVRDKGTIPLTTIDMQTNQQTMYNPCLPLVGQSPTNFQLAPTDNSQLFKIIPASTPKFSPYMVNPPVYPYIQASYVVPQQIVSNYVQPVNQQIQNGPIQVSGPSGQYYICNPVAASSNNIINVPGVEVRREATNLQDLLGSVPKPVRSSKRDRASQIICPVGYEACSDDSKCIPKHQVCDNEAHCNDGSDETFCTCKERVGKLRTCDGYFDCPNGEDELGCFGCDKDEFSCDDWSKFRKSTCIPIEQRCDNIKQCDITGKDEEDCSVLADNIGEQPFNKISNSIGFLHRNYKGKWYPTCFGVEIWALDVCKVESGPISVFPRTHMVLTTDNYDGPFINILPDKEISLVKNCVQDRAAFVECPALFCGMRMTTKNPYRPNEVDISAENVVDDLERVANKHHIHGIKKSSIKEKENEEEEEVIKEISELLTSKKRNTNTDHKEEPILGDSRVVGGKPSQPAAWPWLVSIYRNGIFHCGGVLIHESWIVSAAHCTDRYWQYYFEIQAGMLRRFSFAPMEQHRWATVVITNENYDRGTLRNDIALMKLSAPVRFNRYVRPICLPSELTAGRDFHSGPSPGSICTTIGWGATIEHGSDPDHMREVEVPILDHCKHADDLDEDEICAGLSEGGKDACQGDSGGPLMCRNPNNPNQWYLAGIVSHGEGCARPDEPGVYTKVGKYVGWITENIGEDKFISRFPLQHCPGYICKTSKKCLPKKHHCDKIVDCLFGDDEADCRISFHNLFKHARESDDDGKSELGSEKIPKTNVFVDMFNINNVNITTNQNVTENLSSNNTTENDTTESFFTCETLVQIIPFNKKCNKIVDCEDGTDEANCQCVDYVRSQNLKAICDGVTDCYDLSDEQCVQCHENEYYCRLSRKCIDITKRCNGVSDCFKSEDEWDCVALTNGQFLILDSDSRPKLSMSGIITTNHNGTWKPFCLHLTENAANKVSDACNFLGFEEYISYQEYQVEDKPLITIEDIKQDGSRLDKKQKEPLTHDSYVDKNKTCSGLFVKCSNVSLDSSVHNIHLNNVSDEVELYTTPWNAVIYSDGIYRCMGAILNSQWIVTSVNSFEGITELKFHYVAVLLGKGKANLPVKGPHEQTLRVVESVRVPNSDIVLLRTEKKMIYSRYVKHLRLNVRRDGMRIEKCVAIGLHDNKAKYEFLWPIKNCDVGFRCFEIKLKTDCKESSSWSGTIICDSGSGWYPAAVYFEKDGLCGLSSVQKYTSVMYHKKEIRRITEQISIDVDAPICNGFRCALGECINKTKTCNGIPDCRGEEDEASTLCYENERLCHLTGECECRLTEMKCKNKKCIPKNKFCDRKDDCGDFSDEPDVCDCKSYLERTSPSKICDGIVHCMDRTDEDPSICPCRSNGFQCLSGTMCIANDMVCDGIEDCPNGEDEKVCYNIVNEHNETSNAGELVSRTGGVWHSGCFKSNYTQEELETICQHVGFEGGTANQLMPPKNIQNVNTLRPVLDDFEMIWIHRSTNAKLLLGLRSGNEPYVNFVPDKQCFKLFLACL